MRLAHNACQTASDLSRRGVLANASRDAKWSREQSDSRNRLLSALIQDLNQQIMIVVRSTLETRIIPSRSKPESGFDQLDSPIIGVRQRMILENRRSYGPTVATQERLSWRETLHRSL